MPPGAVLEYEVELVQWEAATEEKPCTDMLFEERLEAGKPLLPALCWWTPLD